MTRSPAANNNIVSEPQLFDPDVSPPAVGSEEPALSVSVIRSPKRKKTAEARMIDGTLVIRIPGRCTRAEEGELVDHFVDKFSRARARARVELAPRADELARRYGLQQPSSIVWVSNQKHRWGSCTPANGTVRLSDRMAGFPQWVIDYVIVHELAHLDEFHHNDRFWAIVARYELSERARGYLIAKAGDQDCSGS